MDFGPTTGMSCFTCSTTRLAEKYCGTKMKRFTTMARKSIKGRVQLGTNAGSRPRMSDSTRSNVITGRYTRGSAGRPIAAITNIAPRHKTKAMATLHDGRVAKTNKTEKLVGSKARLNSDLPAFKPATRFWIRNAGQPVSLNMSFRATGFAIFLSEKNQLETRSMSFSE